MRKSFWVVLLILVLSFGVAAAQAPDAVPFRVGEVAVYATPDELPGETIVKYLPNAGISIVRVEPGREFGKIHQLQSGGRRAGVNRIAQAFATVNDPLFSYQWHFTNVQAQQAWDITTGGQVVVAVLDTGLVTDFGTYNEDGIGCVVTGYNAVNGAEPPVDGDGHGTHVSGTVAQTSNNGFGVAGLAHGACVMPVKVLGDDGSGSFADIAQGIYWAADNGAKVINMSLGTAARYGLTRDPIVDPALDYAYAKGVTVVCASGNDGSRRNVSYPAIYPTTIAVGATDYANKVTSYSNKGTGLDMVAPGGNTSADLNKDGFGDGVLQETRLSGDPAQTGYYFFQGTSMASPHVAAAAAMLYAAKSGTGPDEVRQTLTSTTLDLGEAGYDSTSGYGLLQVYNALVKITGGSGGGGGGCTDADGDGFCINPAEGEPVDCDDNNAAVYPGANDTRGKAGRDGIDNDCDGNADA